ncbi:MAG TPA: gluconokinase [Chthoniobacterales bacterium]|nr:gluconokinase [Chthoniobacterales bacterium]
MSRPLESLVLAIDIGTSSVRTALFDAKARVNRQSRASEKYRVRHSADRGAELDPRVLLRAARKCLRQTRRLTKDRVAIVAGSGFWHSLLGLDRDGQPLTPIFTWAEARCAEDAARLRDKLDEHEIQQRTGCMLRASFWPAKLLWLRRTQPRLFGRVTRWVSPAEWIFEQLFAVRACSRSMASGTGLYNFARRDWDEELLEICRLTRSRLNPLRDSLPTDDRTIFSAIGDGAASNLGSGASHKGIVAINVGTSAAVRAVIATDSPPLPFGLFRFVIDEQRSLLGGAVSNAGNLRAWCLRELRLPNDERSIEKILRRPSAASSALTILPFWVSERAPTWPEHLDGVIHGLTQVSSAADLLYAATAAVGHRLAAILNELENAIGRSKRIVASGGIVQSPASLQILADSLGRDLDVSADQEASLRGAAVYALEQLGAKIATPKRGKRIRHRRAQAIQAREQRARQEDFERLVSSWTR